LLAKRLGGAGLWKTAQPRSVKQKKRFFLLKREGQAGFTQASDDQRGAGGAKPPQYCEERARRRATSNDSRLLK